jgi:hypothetical protein
MTPEERQKAREAWRERRREREDEEGTGPRTGGAPRQAPPPNRQAR